MIRIANPIYDAAFKYLLTEDNRVAKIFLSKLTGKEILHLTVLTNEIVADKDKKSILNPSLTVYRLDFAATIKHKSGEEEIIIIEMQKAKFLDDIMRFRRYLGAQFMDRKHSYTPKSGKFKDKKIACPIYTIYFLAHCVDNYKESSINIGRSLSNALTNEAIEDNADRIFTNSLFHKGLIIQVPNITADIKKYTEKENKNKLVNKHLNKILSIFNQSNIDNDTENYLIFDESNLEKEPKWAQRVIRNLQSAGADMEVRKQMRFEDEFWNDLEDAEREHIRVVEFAQEEQRKAVEKAEIAESKADAAVSKADAAESKADAAESKADVAESKADAAESKADAAESKAELAENKAEKAEKELEKMCAELARMKNKLNK